MIQLTAHDLLGFASTLPNRPDRSVGVDALDLVLIWDDFSIPVPAWLLWVAHGFDAAPVEAYLGGTL